MSRRVGLVLALLIVFVGVGAVVPLLVRGRSSAAVLACQNNLRELTRFAADPDSLPAAARGKVPRQIPPGTVVLPDVPADQRLSWFPVVLPILDQKRLPVAEVGAIDVKQPWPAEPNQRAARAKLTAALCPGNPAEVGPDQPGVTMYVGVGGLGTDAPANAPPHRAGCFRYDSPTPLDAITDGLSQTLLIGERSGDLGPWLRGGPSTVRGLDDRPDAPPLIGPGGQFGGNHPGGANWAFADWSVRTFTDRADPRVLHGLATVAGRGHDPLPGE